MKDIALILRIMRYVFILPSWLATKSLPEVLRLLTQPQSAIHLPLRRVIVYSLFWTSLRIPSLQNYCLRRSLILYKFLREAGVDVAINIGVRIDERGRLSGHSWLTLAGKPYLTRPETASRFKPLFVFPADNLAGAYPKD